MLRPDLRAVEADHDMRLCTCLCCAVGAIIGFSLVWGKGGGVQWSSATNTFPYVAGVVPIVLSWIISPLLAGILALIIFLVTRWAQGAGHTQPATKEASPGSHTAPDMALSWSPWSRTVDLLYV